MKKIAIIVAPNLALFELGVATDLFTVNHTEENDWYQTQVVSFHNMPLETSRDTGVSITVPKINNLDKFDMVIIPGWAFDSIAIPTKLAESIIKLHHRGGRVISLCSGVFLLAELGLLDQRLATTHWLYREAFQKHFPHIDFCKDILYQYDGLIGCSAGSSAAIDLCIEVIRDDYGYQVANQAARRMVVAAHRNGGQSQYVETPIIEKPNQFADTLDWAISKLAAKIDINTMAKKANMSRRTFDRKFRSSMDMSPKQWIIHRRLHLAKNLLETNNDSIDLIAYNSGFEKPETLRLNFRKYLKLSPSQYRHQFCCNPKL